jgi:hypothetical protein
MRLRDIIDRKSREKTAASFGLAPDASWDNIADRYTEEERQKYAAVFGLPPNSPWSDIMKKTDCK